MCGRVGVGDWGVQGGDVAELMAAQLYYKGTGSRTMLMPWHGPQASCPKRRHDERRWYYLL